MRKEPGTMAGILDGDRAAAVSLYTGRANRVLICLKAAIWEEPKYGEFRIGIHGVPSARPARLLLNPSGGSGSTFSWRAHKVSIAPLFPPLQGAPNIGSVSLFLFYLLTCFFVSSQSFPPIFPFTLNFSLSFITSGQIIIFLHLFPPLYRLLLF